MSTVPLRALLLLALAPAVHGQSIYATLTGAVTDPSDAVVPNARIELRDVKSGYVYEASTNDAGLYTVPNLRDGEYRLRITAAGFRDFESTGILLAARDLRRLDAKLEVGSVGTTVAVDAGGVALIETEQARISDVKDREQLRQLPLTLRRAWDYFQLTPNLLRSSTSFQLRFAGSRLNQGDALIDGTSVSNAFNVLGPLLDNTESYQEMRIDMAGNSAEYAGIGQVSITSRGGSNEWRGTLADYYSTRAFNARNPFALVNTGAPGHRLIASAGGPVWLPKVYNGRSRTFFFFTAEWDQGGSGQTFFNPTVPLATWREGDFSRLLPQTVIRDPFGGNQPFPGNVIPASRLNPVSLRIQQRFYPLPNFGDAGVLTAQNFRGTARNVFVPNPQFTGRADHRFTEKVFTFFRISWQDRVLNQYEGGLPSFGMRDGARPLRSWTASYTHTLRPNLVSEFRLGFASDNIPAVGPVSGAETTQLLGLRGLAPGIEDGYSGVYNVTWQNLGLTGLSQIDQCVPCNWNRTYTLQEHVSMFVGKHTLKAGFTYLGAGVQEVRQQANLFGGATFSNRFTGHAYADFLLGIPTSASRSFPALPQDTFRRNYGVFVQDDYRITRQLTLNLGLRWDYLPGWTEANGRQAVFDIATGKIVVPDGALDKVSPLLPRNYVDVIEAKQAGLPNTLVRPDRNNFAPRIGFAWRPFGQNTVVRGAYGIFYDVLARNPAFVSTPFNIVEPAFVNPQPVPTLILPQAFPATAGGGPSTVTIPAALQANLRIPYSMQYNLTVEHQRGDTGVRLSYIGTNTRQGTYVQNINQPVADTRPFVDKPRPYPLYPAVNLTTNGAGHQYHAFTTEVERRTRRGLTLQGSYTWARDIGDLEFNESPEDAFNRQRERAVWADIPTHRLNANFLYELPFGRRRAWLSALPHWADAAIGGWQVGGIYTWDSGQFMTPLWTGPDPTGTRFTQSRTPAVVTIRPDALCNGNLDSPTPDLWFNAACFAAPQPGRFGTSAKNVLYGPTTNVLHATLSKTFLIRERVRLRTELLATNALNTPNYLGANTNITATGQVGVITSTVNRNNKMDSGIPRVLQLHVRLDW